MHSNGCFSLSLSLFISFLFINYFLSILFILTWSIYTFKSNSNSNFKDPYQWSAKKKPNEVQLCETIKPMAKWRKKKSWVSIFFLAHLITFDYYCLCVFECGKVMGACQRAINCGYYYFCGFINLLFKFCFLYECAYINTHAHSWVRPIDVKNTDSATLYTVCAQQTKSVFA